MTVPPTAKLLIELDNLRAEREQIVAIVKEWCDKQGHDKCHYYPELFEKLAGLLKLEVAPFNLPPEAEFEVECGKYRRQIYHRE